MAYAVSLSLSMAALWMLLSWRTEPMILGLGGASVLLSVGLAARARILDRETIPVHLIGRGLLYWAWLLREIVKANFRVARLILTPSLPVSPTLAAVKASQRTRTGQAIYANSITLTPGTISVDVDDGVITVHAIVRAGALALQDGEMDRRVTWMEGAQ